MANATLTTLTPVHIGSGTTYNRNIDFVQEGARIGIVDADKVAALIGHDRQAIDQWVNAIEQGTPLLDFLQKGRGLRNVKIEEISSRICDLKNTQHRARDLKEQFRSPLVGACLPGSSLKGAIRTAIWENLADDDSLKKLSANDLKNRRGKWDDKEVAAKLFGKDATEQSTRFLKVGDAHFGDAATEVHEMKILNKVYNGWSFKNGSSLFETILTNRTANFDFKVDYTLLQSNRKANPGIWPDRKIGYLMGGTKGVAKVINDLTILLLDWEIKMLFDAEVDYDNSGKKMLEEYKRLYKIAQSCQENEFVVRVGGHSGWIFTTGAWVRKEALNLNDYEMKSLRKTIQRNKEYDMDLWPKTRKTTDNGTIFGFVKIQL